LTHGVLAEGVAPGGACATSGDVVAHEQNNNAKKMRS
jgi:hypothetical protein